MIANGSGPTIGASPPARRRILGVRVDDVTWSETQERLDGFVSSGAPHQIVTPNPEIVMTARANPAFRDVIDRADLAPCDGVGLQWAGRVLGQPIREVVPGSDLVPRMAAAATARGQRWFLLGAAEGVAEEAAEALRRLGDGLQIAGTHAGEPDPGLDEAICARIEAAGPIDVLLVAYGAPDQDMWIARNQRQLRVPVAMGVGGTFDFLAGRSVPPPRWIRRARLIWLHRLVHEPWRWRRQARLVPFVGLVLRERLARRA